MANSNAPRLTPKQLQRTVFRRLAAYTQLSFLEQFAMFMGKAQVLELALKHLLVRLYDYDFDRLERWTLGRVVRELKERGLRGDFVALMESLVEHRNFIAHELLASTAMFRQLVGRRTRIPRPIVRPLDQGIFELEQVMYVQDWLEKHNAWTARRVEPTQPRT